jgi:hypothetical protein
VENYCNVDRGVVVDRSVRSVRVMLVSSDNVGGRHGEWGARSYWARVGCEKVWGVRESMV